MNAKRPTPRHIILRMVKVKETVLKSAGEKQSHLQEEPPQAIHGFFNRNFAGRREWQNLFKVLKGKNLQPRILCSAKISFRMKREMKSFSDKQKLKDS